MLRKLILIGAMAGSISLVACGGGDNVDSSVGSSGDSHAKMTITPLNSVISAKNIYLTMGKSGDGRASLSVSAEGTLVNPKTNFTIKDSSALQSDDALSEDLKNSNLLYKVEVKGDSLEEFASFKKRILNIVLDLNQKLDDPTSLKIERVDIQGGNVIYTPIEDATVSDCIQQRDENGEVYFTVELSASCEAGGYYIVKEVSSNILLPAKERSKIKRNSSADGATTSSAEGEPLIRRRRA
ncbi:MAG: hypothetical protein ON057_000432 [Glomeribacter sp. 1016415]|nr:hypothetical protein [Glomeribacter sp. 1016415]